MREKWNRRVLRDRGLHHSLCHLVRDEHHNGSNPPEKARKPADANCTRLWHRLGNSSAVNCQWSVVSGQYEELSRPDAGPHNANHTCPTIHFLQQTTNNGQRTTDQLTTRQLQFPAAPPSTSRTPSDSGCLYPPARNNSSSVRICDPGPFQS